MAFDYKNMSENEVKEMAERYAGKMGYAVLDIRKLKSPADDYLRYVICHNESKKEYAVWMLNIQMGGLHYGHYFGYYSDIHGGKEKAYNLAKEDYKNR